MQMNHIPDLSLRTLSFGPSQGDKPKNIVLLLHGLGSNADDLISLAPIMAGELPETLFLSVDAPEQCDMAPFGHQWFSLQNRAPDAILSGLQTTAQPALHKVISEIKEKYGIENKDLALLGFSQGTMTSLYTALHSDAPFAGVLGYSGALFLNPATEQDLTKQPICLVHGTADDVVAFESLADAETTLKEHDIEIETCACPNLGHSIDEKGLGTGVSFLQRVLGYA